MVAFKSHVRGDYIMEYVTLTNGVKMPMLGYGVYQTKPAETEKAVSTALVQRL